MDNLLKSDKFTNLREKMMSICDSESSLEKKKSSNTNRRKKDMDLIKNCSVRLHRVSASTGKTAPHASKFVPDNSRIVADHTRPVSHQKRTVPEQGRSAYDCGRTAPSQNRQVSENSRIASDRLDIDHGRLIAEYSRSVSNHKRPDQESGNLAPDYNRNASERGAKIAPGRPYNTRLALDHRNIPPDEDSRSRRSKNNVENYRHASGHRKTVQDDSRAANVYNGDVSMTGYPQCVRPTRENRRLAPDDSCQTTNVAPANRRPINDRVAQYGSTAQSSNTQYSSLSPEPNDVVPERTRYGEIIMDRNRHEDNYSRLAADHGRPVQRTAGVHSRTAGVTGLLEYSKLAPEYTRVPSEYIREAPQYTRIPPDYRSRVEPSNASSALFTIPEDSPITTRRGRTAREPNLGLDYRSIVGNRNLSNLQRTNHTRNECPPVTNKFIVDGSGFLIPQKTETFKLAYHSNYSKKLERELLDLASSLCDTLNKVETEYYMYTVQSYFMHVVNKQIKKGVVPWDTKMLDDMTETSSLVTNDQLHDENYYHSEKMVVERPHETVFEQSNRNYNDRYNVDVEMSTGSSGEEMHEIYERRNSYVTTSNKRKRTEGIISRRKKLKANPDAVNRSDRIVRKITVVSTPKGKPDLNFTMELRSHTKNRISKERVTTSKKVHNITKETRYTVLRSRLKNEDPNRSVDSSSSVRRVTNHVYRKTPRYPNTRRVL